VKGGPPGTRTFFALLILKSLESGKGSTSSYDLMTEAGLVLLEVVVVVDLLVVVLALVWWSCISTTTTKCKHAKPTYPRNP
jgi:hypothetical protein